MTFEEATLELILNGNSCQSEELLVWSLGVIEQSNFKMIPEHGNASQPRKLGVVEVQNEI